MGEYIYSNEIVFRGHPDKVADQISDKLLDSYLEKDSDSRCGIEVCGGKGKIFITGEVASKGFEDVNVEEVTKSVLSDVGYNTDYEIINNIGGQSEDIAKGVDIGGAGDQGMMFGYACNETPQLLPKAMVILQSVAYQYDIARKMHNELLPDGKAQITGRYKDGKLISIKDFTLSYQNTETNRVETDKIVREIIDDACITNGVRVENYHINPTGAFRLGGFDADAGLTGRKIVVDNYHSFASVGGGCFSGKDGTKVDRSGAYMARKIARAVLQSHNAERCDVQLSYAIGLEEPLAIYVKCDNEYIKFNKDAYQKCTPKAMIESLGLNKPIFYQTAQFGHFGNVSELIKDFSWEA